MKPQRFVRRLSCYDSLMNAARASWIPAAITALPHGAGCVASGVGASTMRYCDVAFGVAAPENGVMQ